MYSSKNPPIAIIVAISPAANTSPIIIDDIIAIETSKSAFMSNSLIKPSAHSLNIGIPHNIKAIHDICSIFNMKLKITEIAEIII